MRLPPGRFADERRRYRLAFTCERCTYFDPWDARCAHGYPTDDHRLETYEGNPATEVVFCKDFDLV